MKHSFKKAIAILLVAASLTLIGTVSVFAAAPQPDASVQAANTWTPKLSKNANSIPMSTSSTGATCKLNWFASTKKLSTVCTAAPSKTIRSGHASSVLATANYATGEAATLSEEAYASYSGGNSIDSGYTTWTNTNVVFGKAICDALMLYQGSGSDSWVITGTFS